MIVVTGASGLLGKKVVKLALDAGYQAYSVYNSHPVADGHPVHLDLTDETKVKEFFRTIRPDAVIHAASVTDVDLCEHDPDLAMKVNGIATGFVARASEDTGSFLVYVSTDYVFDGNRGLYKENDTPNPVNVYGESKLMGEQQTQEYCKHFAIARTSVLYGWCREYRPNFATWLIGKLEKHENADVVIDQHASPTLNTQLAGMLLEVATRRLEGVIHLAGGTRVSRHEFAVRLARRLGLDENLLVPVTSDSIDWKAKRPRDSSLRVAVAQKRLNHKPAALVEAIDEFAREAPTR